MKLQETLKGLIYEATSMDELIDCIKNKKVCMIYYDGDVPGGPGLREIEPVAFGTSKAGNKVFRAWEREGASHRDYTGEKPLPGWRFFRLDKTKTLQKTGENFLEMRPNFNPNGDKSMTSVIIVSKF